MVNSGFWRNIRVAAWVLCSAPTHTTSPKSQANMMALWFLKSSLFLADSQAEKILLYPCKPYLVISHFPASTYKTVWEEKQGSNSPSFDKSPVERKPTVFPANVACCRNWKWLWPWFLPFRPWHIWPQPGSFAQDRHWAGAWNRNKVWSVESCWLFSF